MLRKRDLIIILTLFSCYVTASKSKPADDDDDDRPYDLPPRSTKSSVSQRTRNLFDALGSMLVGNKKPPPVPPVNFTDRQDDYPPYPTDSSDSYQGGGGAYSNSYRPSFQKVVYIAIPLNSLTALLSTGQLNSVGFGSIFPSLPPAGSGSYGNSNFGGTSSYGGSSSYSGNTDFGGNLNFGGSSGYNGNAAAVIPVPIGGGSGGGAYGGGNGQALIPVTVNGIGGNGIFGGGAGYSGNGGSVGSLLFGSGLGGGGAYNGGGEYNRVVDFEGGDYGGGGGGYTGSTGGNYGGGGGGYAGSTGGNYGGGFVGSIGAGYGGGGGRYAGSTGASYGGGGGGYVGSTGGNYGGGGGGYTGSTGTGYGSGGSFGTVAGGGNYGNGGGLTILTPTVSAVAPPAPIFAAPPPALAVGGGFSGSLPCPRGAGYYRHPVDCNRFYRCVDVSQTLTGSAFKVYEFNCPAGTVYSIMVWVCVWPYQREAGTCFVAAPPPGSVPIAFPGPPGIGIGHGSGYAGGGYSGGSAGIISGGSYGSSNYGAVSGGGSYGSSYNDDPKNRNLDIDFSEEDSNARKSRKKVLAVTRDREETAVRPRCLGVGFFAHPFDCTQFAQCWKSSSGDVTGYYFKCPPKTAFNSRIPVCDDIANMPDLPTSCLQKLLRT